MRLYVLLAICIVIFHSLPAQRTDHRLHKKISHLLAGFDGEAGIYIKDLRKNKVVAIHADTLFPTASMIKIPILTGIMAKILTGRLSYHQVLEYKDSLYYAGSDITASLKNGEKITLAKLIMLMLTTSDNTASLWLQSLAGGGSQINALLDSLGLTATKINSRTPGRDSLRQLYGWGQTTPREMAILLEKIYKKQIFSPSACAKMLRALGRNYWDEQALAEIPPTIEVFSKNGAVNASRSEVLLVNAPHRPFLFCIITKNNKDQSWSDNNEAWVLTRKISRLLWSYYEPNYKW